MVPRPGEPPHAMTLFDAPHVAKGVIVSERDGRTFQPCAFCGEELVGVETGSGEWFESFAVGECVGDGCSGTRKGRNHDPSD